MFPRVYQTLTANATVVAMVGNRIGRHGVIQQTETRPYITWQIVLGQPYDNLSSTPCGDFTTVQIDCYCGGVTADADIERLAEAVRAALDAAGVYNRVTVNNRDPDTRLYRLGIDADFIAQRA